MLEDNTDGDVDEFFVSAVCFSTFTCAASGNYIRLWPGASGYKYTGQSGQKEVHDNATWSGYARLYIPQPPNPPKEVDFTVWGTWNTRVGDDCFNYGGRPPIYSAHWYFGSSDPPGFTGGAGGSEGDRILYEE